MRGDIVTVATQGDFGKPRPALIIQSDKFAQSPSTTFIPLTSHLSDAPLIRVTITPTETNGLRTASQAMVDKVQTTMREKIGAPFGKASPETMLEIDRRLAVFLGIAR